MSERTVRAEGTAPIRLIFDEGETPVWHLEVGNKKGLSYAIPIPTHNADLMLFFARQGVNALDPQPVTESILVDVEPAKPQNRSLDVEVVVDLIVKMANDLMAARRDGRLKEFDIAERAGVVLATLNFGYDWALGHGMTWRRRP